MKPFEDPSKEFTMVKNVIFDRIMHTLSSSGWKVLCVTIRKTWGWEDVTTSTGRKLRDKISYSQFVKMTGLSRTTVVKAVKECLGRQYLLRHQVGVDANFGKPVYYYELNTDFDLPPHGTESVLSETDIPDSGTWHGTDSGIGHVPESGNTKERKQPKNDHDIDDLTLTGGPKTAEQAWLAPTWKEALRELEQQMTRGAFSRWLGDSRLLDIQGGTATVQVRDSYAVDWCSTRLRVAIERTLSGILADGDLVIEFVREEV